MGKPADRRIDGRRRWGRRGPDGMPVHQITAARRGLSEDIDARTRRYLISMGVRTVCFLLAIVATGWLRWAFLAGAIFLPYISVVFANAGREPERPLPATLLQPSRPALDAAPEGSGNPSREGDAA